MREGREWGEELDLGEDRPGCGGRRHTRQRGPPELGPGRRRCNSTQARLGLAREPGAQGTNAQEATPKHIPQHVHICVAPPFNFFVPCSDFKFAVRVDGQLRSTSSLHTTALSVSKVTPFTS